MMCGYCVSPESDEGEDIFMDLDEELAHREAQLERIGPWTSDDMIKMEEDMKKGEYTPTIDKHLRRSLINTRRTST
jgi:hypothetical protein